ncbi:PREDICTED: melanophilin isoform X4 [Nanorana parkeri]|uniref:melanophilin isoform X4 n=1 Tax=Nanorana parkeri TaxID=125878 RepID=UPI000855030A|nr:PREDICTED: melanophilin isoform X4 [Nanorana parkeri]
MGRKLDLSKLSDEEAKHVWEVVQRDMSLRKKEEERLEDLKFKLEKESSKRELLSNESQLNNTHCIHCLQPFQFLINSKRQCKDCQFFVCKNCSRYNKKEQGWVCDTCRAGRMVKIGSHEWYQDHVRSRFKRFGSAKVIRSLYMRQQPDARGGSMLSGLQDRVYSLPDINREYLRQARAGMFADDDDEDIVDSVEAQRYSMSFSEFTSSGKDVARKESLVAEAELASVFHQLLQEQGQTMANPEQEFSTEVRLTVNSRRRSLENIWRSSSPSLVPKGSQYSGDMDTSDEERGAAPKAPPKRRSRASSQENVHHPGTQISDLSKRMSAIERMLNRLEEKISVHSDESTGHGVHTDADLEEETLKRKIGELARKISDKGGSSDEEKSPKFKLAVKSSSEISNQKVYMAADKVYGLEKSLHELEETAQQSGTTDSELSELEVSVASAMAQVQQTESEVSDIESRIAALSAAGLTVSPSDKAKRKSSPRASALALSRSTEPFVPSSPEQPNLTSTPSEAKMLSMQQALQKKFGVEMADGPIERNALYRGSLTQRNPNGKNRKADRIFARPVLSQR